jgi:O-succinylbenzoic acid--CoA ligase
MAVVVPSDPADPPEPARLADAVRGELGRTAVPKRFGFTDRLPLCGPGKVDRAAVRALLAGP